MVEQEAVKECRRCHEVKPLADFHRDKNRRDGHYCYCKPCAVEDARRWASTPKRKAIKQEYDRHRAARLKDKLRDQMRANYERKRAEKIAAAKRWANANPERVRLYKQNNKHRRRSVERTGMTWKELRDWKSAQPKVCHWCDIKCARGFVVDHIAPLARGGKHEADNLCVSCRPCNARKSARDPIEWARMIGRLL